MKVEAAIKMKQENSKWEQEILLKMVDRGIDDMEAGRELPLKDAFQKISELRNELRNES